MDPRLLKYYNRELQYIREMGGEFAKEFPKIAGRLGLDGFECADPYVERLLEGFAFLASRVQLKLDAEFPRFTQHLLEMVYPHYLAPTPSMVVAGFNPDLAEGGLADGFTIPRDTNLRSILGKGDRTACEFRTAHDVDLWPLELVETEYFTNMGAVAEVKLPHQQRARAGLRLRFRTTAGLTFNKLALEKLPLYLRGSDQLSMQLYEQLIGHALAILIRPPRGKGDWHELVTKTPTQRVGFKDEQALLPYTARSFQGYRLLQEYFAFPERYMFVELQGLAPAVRRCKGKELDVIVLLDRVETQLENKVSASEFALFCSPAINLFPKRTDRIHLSERENEYHVVPDRTRPLDFEVYQVVDVTGYGTSADREQPFSPFYTYNDWMSHVDQPGYFTVRREARTLSKRQRKFGPRSSYIGSEVFVALVDAKEAPYQSDLRQLGVATLCTNRDLPLHMSVGQTKTDLTMETGAPVEAIQCLAGPTKPRPSYAEGDTTWRLISHLSLNYLSLVDNEDGRGASALRELLSLYAHTSEATIQKQVEGVKSVTSTGITRRIPIPGPVTFGRGLEISVICEETAFEGSGIFLLGAVLEEFFAKYVSINSFTETVIVSSDRGEIMRWPTRLGRRQIL